MQIAAAPVCAGSLRIFTNPITIMDLLLPRRATTWQSQPSTREIPIPMASQEPASRDQDQSRQLVPNPSAPPPSPDTCVHCIEFVMGHYTLDPAKHPASLIFHVAPIDYLDQHREPVRHAKCDHIFSYYPQPTPPCPTAPRGPLNEINPAKLAICHKYKTLTFEHISRLILRQVPPNPSDNTFESGLSTLESFIASAIGASAQTTEKPRVMGALAMLGKKLAMLRHVSTATKRRYILELHDRHRAELARKVQEGAEAALIYSGELQGDALALLLGRWDLVEGLELEERDRRNWERLRAMVA
ncbi:MAG: hypothetical protein M1828_007613 [Chrysothrix sp. TS-e1954]|nr:MAG: hypothetical protein M1828_007613 [Chrysothrix sp. TS-e1954]